MSSSTASDSNAPRSLLSSIRLGEPVLTAASSALKSAGIVVCAIVSPTTLRARSGWISRRRDAWLSTILTSSSSRTPSRFHSSRIRRTPRSASTSGVVTTITCDAISAAIAVASVATAPMSTTVSAWRALTADSTLRATAPSTSSAFSPSSGASSSRKPSLCV